MLTVQVLPAMPLQSPPQLEKVWLEESAVAVRTTVVLVS
jgi:hypothetical protein